MFPDPGATLPTGFPERACPVLWHNQPPDGIRTALRRAAVRCDVLAGLLWRSTMWETSRRQRMGRYRATFCQGRPLEMARTMLQPWQGTSHWIRSLCTSTAKVPSRQSMGQSTKLWELGVPEHTSGTGFWFPTTRSGRSRSRVKRQSATWRRGALPPCAKGEMTLQTPSPRKGQTHTQACFSRRQDSRCVCFPGQASGTMGGRGARFAQVQGLDNRAAAPRSGVRPPRARLKRKLHKEIAAPASGQVCDWLSPVVPTRVSQDRHLDPRTFGGHSLQLGRVFDSGGGALDNAIIFCAKCGAVYSKRADALCRSCCGIPGGRTSQLRKLRSGLFPNKGYPPWTVEHVRRPTLDEATTQVAKLESCEAGSGRIVMGPTTPKKQRAAPQAAVQAHWERVGGAVDNENLELLHFDQGRLGLWEAYGLDDQLVSKLTLKAGGTRQTDLATHVVLHCLFSTAQAQAAMVLPAPKTRQSPITSGTRCWRHRCIIASARCCSRC